jgi:hypothetical protein
MITPSIKNTVSLTGAAARSRDAADSRAKAAWEKYRENELAMIQICDQANSESAESIERFLLSVIDWRDALSPLYSLAPRWVPEIGKESIRQGYGLSFSSSSGVFYDHTPEKHALRLATNLRKSLVESGVNVPELKENATPNEIRQWLSDIRAMGVC